MKIFIKSLKADVGLGDVVKRLVDPHNRLNFQKCKDRQQKLNELLTITNKRSQ